MKNLKIFLAASLVVVLASCSSYSYTSRSSYIHTQDLNTTSLLVDVRPDFTRRIVTVSQRQKTLDLALAQAKYMAVVDNNCDVVVDPIYKAEKRGNSYIVTLTGFAGYYKNPRTLYEDIELLKNVSRDDVEKYLILQDPNVISLMNPASSTATEIINIGGEGHAKCHHQCKPKCEKVTEEPAASVVTPSKKKK